MCSWKANSRLFGHVTAVKSQIKWQESWVFRKILLRKCAKNRSKVGINATSTQNKSIGFGTFATHLLPHTKENHANLMPIVSICVSGKQKLRFNQNKRSVLKVSAFQKSTAFHRNELLELICASKWNDIKSKQIVKFEVLSSLRASLCSHALHHRIK